MVLFINRTVFLVFALLLTVVKTTPSMASELLRADGPYFKDTQGRAVLLRGINLSNSGKTPPFNPLPDSTVLQKLKDWGINNIRLTFIWEAFEPQRGQYDFDYLKKLEALVNAAGRLGISTVLDFHSDAFSRYSIGGCGSGFPRWAIPPGVVPSQPANDASCLPWSVVSGTEYLWPPSGYRKSIEAFYSDAYGVRTRYELAWRQLAHIFKNNPYLIGYDLLNEPWASEKKNLAPLYEGVAKVIRAEDPNTIIMIEPMVMTALGAPPQLPAPSFDNFAYAPHDYDALAVAFKIWFTGGLFIDRILGAIETTADRLKAPIYVGEFGASGNGLGSEALVRHYYNLFDQKFISSAQWDLSQWTPSRQDGWNKEDMSITGSNGQLRKNFIVRPYPMAVSGEPGEIHENFPDLSRGEAKHLSFRWVHRPELGETVFAIPKDTMGGRDFDVNFKPDDPSLYCHFDRSTWTLSCFSPRGGVKNVVLLIHQKDNG